MKTECKGEVGDYCRCWRINVGSERFIFVFFDVYDYSMKIISYLCDNQSLLLNT